MGDNAAAVYNTQKQHAECCVQDGSFCGNWNACKGNVTGVEVGNNGVIPSFAEEEKTFMDYGCRSPTVGSGSDFLYWLVASEELEDSSGMRAGAAADEDAGELNRRGPDKGKPHN